MMVSRALCSQTAEGNLIGMSMTYDLMSCRVLSFSVGSIDFATAHFCLNEGDARAVDIGCAEPLSPCLLQEACTFVVD